MPSASYSSKAGQPLIRQLADRPGSIVGIDAGGSCTRAVLVESGLVVKSMVAGPMNALLTERFEEGLSEIVAALGGTSLGIGMPGLRCEEDAVRLGAAMEARTGCRTRAASDVEVARLGAFMGSAGIVVVAGTGSVAAGWNGTASARAGGHGFLLGDEGGAYWLGNQAVRSMLRTLDAGNQSPLAEAALAVMPPGVDVRDGLEDLVRNVYHHPTNRHLLADLAPIVTGMAATDPECRQICERAADHLASLAELVRGRLGRLPVAAVGGVFEAAAIRDRFLKLTSATQPLAPPSIGAALLAPRAWTAGDRK